jgi:hypothetical protein
MKTATKEITAKQVTTKLQAVLLDQSIRQEMLQRHFYMYGHSTLSVGGNNPVFFAGRDGVRMNIVQSCCDTLVNKIAKNQPRPSFLTDNGEWGMRKKAEKREKFVFGQFYKSDAYRKAPSALLQALVFGDGLMKVHSKDKEIVMEPTLTMEVVFDETESLYGKPRQCWQTRYVDKEDLKAMYPDKADEIDKVQTELVPFYLTSSINTNLVMVVEYWRLPDRKIGKNKYEGGAHMICCGEVELMKEDWHRTGFPFARIPYMKNLLGYWSKGVAEVLTPFQIEINRTLRTISQSVKLCGAPKWLYEYGSKINQAHFNNDVGAMIGYSVTPPQYIAPEPVAQEMFHWFSEMVQRAYAEVGLSELTVTSAKPAGLNSGKALREYNDLETERFSALARSYEDFFIDLSELVLLEAKDIQSKHGRYAVLAPNKNGAELINFKDIDMDQDDYVIQTFPTSMLPKSPAGRLEYVQEMLAGGLLTPEEGMSLLDFPDTQKITKLKTSVYNDVLATIDHMLDTDNYLPPEPYQKLDVAIPIMQSAYLYYKNEKCPDEKLDLIIRWINDAIMMTESIQEQAVMQQEQGDMTSSDLGMPQEPMVDELMEDTTQDALNADLAQEQAAMADTTNMI